MSALETFFQKLMAVDTQSVNDKSESTTTSPNENISTSTVPEKTNTAPSVDFSQAEQQITQQLTKAQETITALNAEIEKLRNANLEQLQQINAKAEKKETFSDIVRTMPGHPLYKKENK